MLTFVRIVSIGIGLSAVCACGRSTPAEHVRRAEEYAAKKDFANAIVEYRTALQQDPKLGTARLKLGDIYAQISDGQNAYREYVRAADTMPDNIDAQLKAGALLLLSNQYAEAKTRAEAVLRMSPRNPGALTLLGNALAGLNDTDGALERLNEAILSDPSQGSLYSNVGVLQLARGDRQMAEASFKKATHAMPDRAEPRVALAHFYRSQGRDAEAEQVLREAVAVDPKSVQANSNLAELYLTTGRASLAEAPLKAIADARQDAESMFALADYYTRTKRTKEAATILDKLAGTSRTYGLAKARLAAIDYTEGRGDEAHKILDELLRREPHNRLGLVLKGRLLLIEKKYDEALDYAKRAVEADPEHSADSHFLLAMLYQNRGQLEESETEFKQTLKVAPTTVGAAVALSQLYSAKNKKTAAVEFAEQAVKLAPNTIETRVTLVRAVLANGDTARADREIRMMLLQFPRSAPVQVQAGALYIARKDIGAARSAFTRALDLDPSSADALTGLVALDLGSNNVRAAIDRLNAHLIKSPNDAGGWFLAAKAYGMVGEDLQTERALLKTIELDPGRVQAFALLGNLHAARGKLDVALQQFQGWAAREPKSVAAQTMIGLTLERMNRIQEAKQVYEKLLAADRHASIAANNLAWLYAETGGNIDQATDLAQMAKSQAPDQPAFNDTLGWIYYKKDLIEQAVPLLKQSLEKDPDNALTHYHLGMAYAKAGEDSKAIEELKKALALDPKLYTADEARRTLKELQI
ncbi:MAG TPA: tetratricopeptide repeat protein [Vicinamibacterales bacterium]|nr:tetratricopeptide repeat protein [Vicinamibacterales bacterium]